MLTQRRAAAAVLLVHWALAIGTPQARCQNYSVLHYFNSQAGDGISPFAGLTRDGAGNVYGTTLSGPTVRGRGVVFLLSHTGGESTVYSFTGADGQEPYGGVTLDPAGNIYGTTYSGGAYQKGVVFKVDSSGSETVLHSFGGSDGANPKAGVIRDAAGNLYGTAAGGLSNNGVVFKLDASGNETVLYNFTGGADGADPDAGLIRDAAGNLYGATYHGGLTGGSVCNSSGSFGCGVVYKVSRDGKATVLYAFKGGADGANPYAGLIMDAAGNLYGTTTFGGLANCFYGCGVVFKLDTAGNETVLYTFTGGADGATPYGGLLRDAAGNLYGTTNAGGIDNTKRCVSGCGVVFKLDTNGTETVLHSFNGPEGANPDAGVVTDPAGNLYGTTYQGGVGGGNCPFGCGVVFRLTP